RARQPPSPSGSPRTTSVPARLGDVVRCFALRRLSSIPVASGLASLVLERVLDGLVIVALGTAALAIAPPETKLAMTALIVFGAAFGAGLVVCVVAWILGSRPELPGWLNHPRARAAIDGTHAGARRPRVEAAFSIRRRPHFAVWALEWAVYLILARDLGLVLHPMAWVAVMVLLTLGLVAPSAPAFLGVFEGLIIASLAAYGVEEGRALAFAVLLHVVHSVPGTLVGIYYSLRYGVRFGEAKVAASATCRRSRNAPRRRDEVCEGLRRG
ncbi:MAG: flippase-like domain-containing protein, partial [Myxococcales bacterium]|nr:flippase-like domain-containing protein [Myxococcales bacterium]